MTALDEVTTLPVELRERMAAEGFVVGLPEIVQAAKSVDGTERYLMRMFDGETVETVWMPDGDGGERGDGSEAAAGVRCAGGGERRGGGDGDGRWIRRNWGRRLCRGFGGLRFAFPSQW